MTEKRKKKAGLPPGSLVYTGDYHDVPLTISLTKYDANNIEIQTLSLDETLAYQASDSDVSWIDITGLSNSDAIGEIGTAFGMNRLQLEDLLNIKQRPKAEVTDEAIFLTFRMLFYANNTIQEEQISIYLIKNCVISFQEKPGDVFNPVRERLSSGLGRIRSRKADYLVYALIDVVVDTYLDITEQIGSRQEDLEDQLEGSFEKELEKDIRLCKRDLITLRKASYPLREAVSTTLKGDIKLIDKSTLLFLSDAYDHLIQLTELIETYRDLNGDLRDIYINSLSNRMNEIMKVLTIMSTIFIPLSFLAGVYGMNFDNLPELHWPNGYSYFWVIALVLVISMLSYFRYKKWL